ncbi:hypothetical protein [Cellulomonas persica]|uniref:hypothetical protein n=1 Tax=Cellulomonas persica TaxID=76861 RepID=UPI001649869C|nr:hypothetical protein [Cellulomonas persica]
MTTHQPDEHDVDPQLVEAALRRVAAADPAADAVLDTQHLHATLAATTGVQLPTDELAAARSRRRRTRWLQAAAAVAAVAVVGTGGYAVGANGSDPTIAPPISLGARDADDAQAADGAAEIAGGPLSSTAESAGDARMMAYGGRQVFHATGLPTEGGSQAAWAFDAASVYSEATLERVADVFGVTGDITREYGLAIGVLDGSGPNVSLSPDGQASVSYYDPTRDPWSCETLSAPDKPQDDGAASSDGASGDGVDIVLGDETQPAADCAGDAPSESSAISTAKEVLDELGLDADAFTFDASSESSASTNVTGTLVVDDQSTGAAWTFVVMDDGVQSAYGPLAPLVELGDYDVISPADAVERLNDPRFSATQSGIWPLAASARAAEEPALVDDGAASDEATVPPTLHAGDPIAWPVTDVTITGARLGVALQYLDNGASALIPAYELTDAAGASWSVIAVVEDQLDLTS